LVIHDPTLHPFLHFVRNVSYYLWGYSLELNRYLEYRVDRIERTSLRVLPQRASPPPAHRMLSVQVRLSAKLARSGTMPRFSVIDSIELDAQGGLLITAQDYTDFRIIQTLLRYGEHAEILSPSRLREKMREVVAEMGKVYERDEG